MGQIVGLNAKCKRANCSAIKDLGILANREYVLISSDNSMNSEGHGYFDSYIVGNGESYAKDLPIYSKEAYYFYLYNKSLARLWNSGITFNLKEGITYILTWELTSQIYFRVYNDEDTSSTIITAKNITGPYTFEFTPTYNIPKFDVYSSVAGNNFSIKVKNENKSILFTNDVVDNLNDGGSNVPLSAEQGRAINNKINFIYQYTIQLNNGTISNKGYASDSFTHAKAVFINNGFTSLSIKKGYQYKLYGADIAIYNNTFLTTLVGNYTSGSYRNNSSYTYLWIDVKKEDDSSIQRNELYNIVQLEYENSLYTYKNITNVNEYYKLGVQYRITGYEIIDGEGWDTQGALGTNTVYSRTDYINVVDIDAIKMYVETTYDSSSYCSRIFCKWFDEDHNPVGFSKHLGGRKTNIITIGVPENAYYVSVHQLGVNAKNLNIYGFKHEDNIADSVYYNSFRNPIGHLARVSLIITYGQSLGTGSDATVITLSQSYIALRKLINTNNVYAFGLLRQANTSSYEDPRFGLGEMFVEAIEKENNLSVYSNEWERHYIIVASCGSGGKTIADLTGDSMYANITNVLTTVKNLCDEFNYSLDVPIWAWMQGEQDMKAAMSSSDYKTALLALHDKICGSIATITGITKRPKCIVYQPASQCLYNKQNTQYYNNGTYTFTNPYLEFQNAYVELLRDNDEFVASCPVYIFDGTRENNTGFIHLDSRSYKMLGAYNGYAAKKALIDDKNIKGVIPLTITVDGTTISIKYNVPCPPLKFDTEWVKETPLINGVHNYGFNVVKSDNTELITNVSVFDDTVTIECSESPIGAKLRYGLNGDYIHMTNSEYWGIDGRIHGGRGNLRDSQGDYVQKYIKEYNQTLRMDNWAYCFEELLTEPEGE